MDNSIAVARCHEIQLSLRDKDVNRFEAIPRVGMAVQLALHLRGLPVVDYERAKLVAASILGIPRVAFDQVLGILAEIEFVRLGNTTSGIRTIIPTVPYFDELYVGLGDYLNTGSSAKLDEFEALTLAVVDRLAGAPHNADSLASQLGAERKAFNNTIEIGTKGGFLYTRRARAKDILLNPTYFSENADIFADHVAASGATSVQRTLELLRQAQGWPLSVIEATGEINGTKISPSEVLLLRRLAEDGAIKPPSINTSHAGNSLFLFTPTPMTAKVSPLKREVYERAIALVSAIRQGQLLPNRFRIRNPAAVLYTLKTDLQLRPTSDYSEQYNNLVKHRIARLEPLQGGFFQLKIIATPENIEALNIAYSLIQGQSTTGLGVDQEAVSALVGPSEYVESLISSKHLREKQPVSLAGDTNIELEQLLLEL